MADNKSGGRYNNRRNNNNNKGRNNNRQEEKRDETLHPSLHAFTKGEREQLKCFWCGCERHLHKLKVIYTPENGREVVPV